VQKLFLVPMKPLGRQKNRGNASTPAPKKTLSLQSDFGKQIHNQIYAPTPQLSREEAAIGLAVDEFFVDLRANTLARMWEAHGFLDQLFDRGIENAVRRVEEDLSGADIRVKNLRHKIRVGLVRGTVTFAKTYPKAKNQLEVVHTYAKALGAQFQLFLGKDDTPQTKEVLALQAETFRTTLDPKVGDASAFEELPTVEDILYSYKRHLGSSFLYSNPEKFFRTFLGDLGDASDAFEKLYPFVSDDELIFEHVDALFERYCIIAMSVRSQIHEKIRMHELKPYKVAIEVEKVTEQTRLSLEKGDGTLEIVSFLDMKGVSVKTIANILTTHFTKQYDAIRNWTPPLRNEGAHDV